MMDDRCEICGRRGRVIEAMVRDPWGNWHRITVHVVCENNRVAQNRLAGMAGRN